MGEEEAVWITGIGLVTPLGHDLNAFDEHLLNGRSAVDAVASFPTQDYPSRIAAQVPAIPTPPGHDRHAFESLPRLEQAALSCVDSALRDAGLWDRHYGMRVGLVMGIGAEWLEVWEADAGRGVDRIFDPFRDAETTVDRIYRSLGFSGPALTLSAACASGNSALEIGRTWLRLGLVDMCVAGGCEMSVTPLGLATFGNLRALSRRNEEPRRASRPFDRNRDGFVLGEGGVAFALESSAGARRRSARAYAEVAGYGASSDAHHHVIPSPDPAPAAAAVTRALADARINPEEVDHINAHATGTPVGDPAEAAVLHRVFGPSLYRIPVTSTKSMTGHLLTAAGMIEAAACITAMKHRAIPPTINLDEPDVDLCLVANQARDREVRIALSNSFGFGGSNTCVVLKAV